jgi:hypothetical protein
LCERLHRLIRIFGYSTPIFATQVPKQESGVAE